MIKTKRMPSKKRITIAIIIAGLAMLIAYFFSNKNQKQETPVAQNIYAEAPLKPTELAILTESPNSNNVWHLYDMYKPEGSTLTEKSEAAVVSINHKIRWTQKTGFSALVQVSNAANFSSYDEYKTSATSIPLTKAYAGENYWRVSLDNGQTWSQHEKFNVSRGFSQESKVSLEEPVRIIYLKKPLLVTNIGLQSNEDTIGFIAQVSDSIAFHPNSLIFWLPKENPKLNISNIGTFYYRFRGVNKNQELSEWSDVQVFHVIKGKSKAKLPLAKSEVATPERAPASYEPDRPVYVAPPPAFESSVSIKLDSKKLKPYNYSYSKSEISAQSFLLNSQSSQQFYQNQNKSLATGIGIHAVAWVGNIGYEASFKSGAFNVSAPEPQTSVRDIEGRIHLRTFTSLPIWAKTEVQTSVFVGYEVYRNVGDLYSNQADLLKFGARIQVPFYQNWSATGEFSLGYGLETSTKLEFSTQLKYYLARKWSLGLGYRLNYFTAGSATAAPMGYLPYREGASESFTDLNYYY